MAKQININSLEAGTIIKVRGQVAYSRIRSQIAGEELRRQNDRDRQAGRPITESAHTKLDLKNCQVLCNDPNNMSLAEKFILERLYTSQKHPENGYCYRAMNKGKYLPQICFRAADNPNVMQQFESADIKGELANDLLVTVYMRVFKANPNNGLSLDYVCVEEPIRFYTPDGANALAAAGIILRPSSAGRELAAPGTDNADAGAAHAAEQHTAGYGEPKPTAAGSNPYSASANAAAADAGNLPYGQNVAGQPGAAATAATANATAAASAASPVTAAAAADTQFGQQMNQPQGLRFQANETAQANTRNYG